MTLERCHLNWEEMTLELDVLVGSTIGRSFLLFFLFFFLAGGACATKPECSPFLFALLLLVEV